MSTNQEAPGNCGQCRHANHGTMDADDGLWACPWVGPTYTDNACRIKYKDSGRYVCEPFDGANCTWRTDLGWRVVPSGYEERDVVYADTGKQVVV